jgi:activator of HSP90 ATPase
MSEKPSAVGSIWNPNSWHWEMKNYTETAKNMVDSKVKNLAINDKDIKITHTKMKFLKAEVNVCFYVLG